MKRFTVVDVSPYLETIPELAAKYGTRYKVLLPDAEFADYQDAKEEALRRSFLNGLWPLSEVRDSEGCLGYAFEGCWESHRS